MTLVRRYDEVHAEAMLGLGQLLIYDLELCTVITIIVSGR